MKNAKSRFGVVALASGSLFLAACTGNNGGNGPDDQGAGESDPDATLAVTTGQGGIPQLDPALSTFQWERVLYPLLWDSMTETTQSGEVEPALAESWEANDDFTEWTFTLRDDVNFSDGEALSAEDVVWNIERVVSDESVAFAHKYVESVTDVNVGAEDEVQLSLDTPNSVLPQALSSVPIIDPDSEDDINSEPVGTGPFTLEEFVPDQRLELQRNDDYWGEAPNLGGITIETSNDTAAAVTALQTGDVDVLWNVPTSDVDPLDADDAINLLEADESTQLHYLSVDTSTPPFDDPDARKALSLALDRDEALDVAYSGFGEPANFNELVSQESWAFDDGDLSKQDQDLDRAAELFASAGVEPGDTLVWWGIAGAYPEWNAEAQLLQEDLAEIDIELDIQNNEEGTWVDKFVPIGNEYPGHIVPNAGGDLNDPAFIYSRLASGACECNWSNSDFDDLLSDGVETDDESERMQIYQEMQQIVTEEAPIIIGAHAPIITATDSTVSGAWVSPTGDLRLERAELSME